MKERSDNIQIKELVVPRMGEGLYEVKITRLLKNSGDKIKIDEVIYEMETDKSIVEIESPIAGTLIEWNINEGEILTIGAVIGKIEIEDNEPLHSSGEEISLNLSERNSSLFKQNLIQENNLHDIPPRTRTYCNELGISLEEITKIPRTNKKLMPDDIDIYLRKKEERELQSLNTISTLSYLDKEISVQQKRLIQRFRRSNQVVIPSTMTSVIEIDKLKLAMKTLIEADKVSKELGFVSEFLVFAYCIAQICKSAPKFRSFLINDHLIREYKNINLGIAINTSTEDLTISTIESADLLDFSSFIRKVSEQIHQTRSNIGTTEATPHIVLSYLGHTGIIGGSPLLVDPSIAVLFLGDSYSSEGKLLAELSLTFDHRIINGMDAAKFFLLITDWIEKNSFLKSSSIHKSILPSSSFTEWLLDKISSLLKVQVKDVAINEPLGIQGFDSIMAIELANNIEANFNIKVSSTIVWEYPTAKSMIDYLSNQIEGSNFVIQPQIPTVLTESNNCFLEEEKIDREKDIAVIGMAGVFPQCLDLTTFWQQLMLQKDLITEIPKERWKWEEYYGNPHLEKNKTKIKWGGFVREIDVFDAQFFNISPAEAQLMDPQQRMLLQTVWNAIADAGYCSTAFKNTNAGIFVGASMSDYSTVIKQSGVALDGHYATGWAHTMLANRISFLLDIHGPSEAIDTACSSSLVAVHRAIQSIREKECEIAIVGGVNAILTPDFYISFNSAGMLSDEGKCKTFDSAANGFVRGEGCGVVILKPLLQAEKDKDYIYGVIKEVGVNHGGRASSLTAPNPKAQAELITKTYRKAGISPHAVSYIEAHGTGTKLGDPIEVKGLQMAFNNLCIEQQLPLQSNYCGVGSLKTNIGHLESAAGIASLIKVLLSLKHRILPGLVHFKNLNPNIELKDSPFYLVTSTKEWGIPTEPTNGLRIAGISSFGFGGTNAHAIISEYPSKFEDNNTLENETIILLSSRDKNTLEQYVSSFKEYVATNHKISIEDIAYTLQIGREHAPCKVAFIASNLNTLYEQLQSFLNKEWSNSKCYTNIKDNLSNVENKIGGDDMTDLVLQWYQNKEFDKVIDTWIKGNLIDWIKVYGSNIKQRIPLPPPLFKKERYWITPRVSRKEV